MLNRYLLILIVAFSFVVRVWNIESAPPSLNWDEISHGYNAYSIMETGRDEWGAPFPYIFRAYGDYKLPVYVYLTVISEKLFGVSEFSVRFPSVLAGTLSVVFVYFLAKELFKKREYALLSSFLLAVLPWSYFLSRIALEANVALTLILASIYFFLKGIKHPKFLMISFLLLGISMWTYNSARVFAPTILIGMLVIFREELVQLAKKKTPSLLFALCIVAMLALPVFLQFSQKSGTARYENVQIIDDGAIAQIEEARNQSRLPDTLSRLIYNRPTYFITRFVGGYTKHFGLDFLFLAGGNNYQFSVPGHGLLYLMNAPFLFIGFWNFLKHEKSKEKKLMICWLFLAPVAASVTREAPHALRSILMLPPLVFVTASGVGYVYNSIFRKNIIFMFVYIVALCLSFADYVENYTSDYRNNYSQVWQYGYKEVVDIVRSKYEDYEKIVVTKKYGEPHEFFLYYMQWPPAKFQTDQSKIQFSQSNWYWTDKFDKFYFINDWDIPKSGAKFTLESGTEIECASCLLVTAGSSPDNWRKIETIYFLDGTVAFEIYEH